MPAAFLAARRGTDHAALTHTWQAVIARGGQPVLVSTSGREVELCRPLAETGPARTGAARGGSARVDVHVGEAVAADFGGLVLPGGLANADQLRGQPGCRAIRSRILRGGIAGGRDLPIPGGFSSRLAWRLADD